jgi:hypothetical protein
VIQTLSSTPCYGVHDFVCYRRDESVLTVGAHVRRFEARSHEQAAGEALGGRLSRSLPTEKRRNESRASPRRKKGVEQVHREERSLSLAGKPSVVVERQLVDEPVKILKAAGAEFRFSTS